MTCSISVHLRQKNEPIQRGERVCALNKLDGSGSRGEGDSLARIFKASLKSAHITCYIVRRFKKFYKNLGRILEESYTRFFTCLQHCKKSMNTADTCKE